MFLFSDCFSNIFIFVWKKRYNNGWLANRGTYKKKMIRVISNGKDFSQKMVNI